MSIPKLVKLSKEGQIVFPLEIREKMRVKPGEKIVILTRGNEIILLIPKKYAAYT